MSFESLQEVLTIALVSHGLKTPTCHYMWGLYGMLIAILLGLIGGSHKDQELSRGRQPQRTGTTGVPILATVI